MIFNFKKDEYEMLVKYGDFEDLEYPYKLFPETSQIEINNKDVWIFMIRFIFKFIMNKLPATGGF